MADTQRSPSPLPDQDLHDQRRWRHGRERDVGFAIGRYLQPPPLFFTRDGHNLFLGDLYRGQAAFLVCGGPSLATHDLSLLQQRGLLTLAVNNAATIVRPQLWTSVDNPGHFADVIWRDPGIWKFIPLDHMEKPFRVRDTHDQLVPSAEKVGDMPAVVGFRRNEYFRAEQWLHESTFNWGNHSHRIDADGNKGSRSVFYIALRLLYVLGVRTVYLLGCDFRMEPGQQNYAFEQDRSLASIRSNNSSYRILNTRLGHLKPYFDAEGFQIFNCTPQSGLTVFPTLKYEEAIHQAQVTIPQRINTRGMYDSQATPTTPQAVPTSRCSPPTSAEPRSAPPILPNAQSWTSSETPLTLLVYAEAKQWNRFQKLWQTCTQRWKWFSQLPAIICHNLGPAVSPQERLCERPGETRWINVPGEGTESHHIPSEAFSYAVQHTASPWLLCLTAAAEVRSEEQGAGLDFSWFHRRPGSRYAY
ncbi:MAG: hypothetical protein LC104_10345, partial [Bacteroidales bacterium]|nr:hypothetical protein [Bacteroidales bacterium]